MGTGILQGGTTYIARLQWDLAVPLCGPGHNQRGHPPQRKIQRQGARSPESENKGNAKDPGADGGGPEPDGDVGAKAPQKEESTTASTAEIASAPPAQAPR